MYIMYLNIKSVPKLSKYHSNPIYLSNMAVMNDKSQWNKFLASNKFKNILSLRAVSSLAWCPLINWKSAHFV